MTRLEVPDCATATKVPSPYVTPCQLLTSIGEPVVRIVQVIPLGEVITRLPDVALHALDEIPQATATNKPLP
jgi:hypothetical protein